MRNRFNINEEEKNRIRGLHGMQVINEQTPTDGDQVAAETEVTMYQGISSRDLTSQAAEFLKNKNDITFDQMVQLIAGCFSDTPNHWLHSLRFESGLSGDIGDGSLEGGDGIIKLVSNNGKKAQVKVCGKTDLAGILADRLKTHPSEVRKGINALLTTTEFPNIYNISQEESDRCYYKPDSNFCKRLDNKRGNVLKWVSKGSGPTVKYTLVKA